MSVPARIEPAAARRATGAAAAAALALAAAHPVGHFWIAGQRDAAAMRADARLLAREVSDLAADNPERWRFLRARLDAILAAAPGRAMRVLDRGGATVAASAVEARGPSMEIAAPVLGAGRIVGEVRIARSLPDALRESAAVAAAAALLALFAFSSLRTVPLRLLRQAMARATDLATHDALTGMPNRALLRDRLGAALAEARRSGATVAVLAADLDRFKPVNDVHGHQAGDRLLCAVAERLRAVLPAGGLAARIGGDKFALVVRIASDGDHPRLAAARLAGRMLSALEEPVGFPDGAAAQVGCSVGIAFSDSEGSADALLDRADAALHRAKADGRTCFRFFEPGMDGRIRERAALAVDLRAAIAADALEPHFQPQVDLATGRVVGFEMLARWTHPRRGQVSPAET
jgi:diguanylate cyclase (GGDEF)-like protein